MGRRAQEFFAAGILIGTAGCGLVEPEPSGAERSVVAPPPPAASGPSARPSAPPALLADNRFENPSFEDGREPWYSLASPERPHWADFEVSDQRAYAGQKSAVLHLRSEGHDLPIRIDGLLREFGAGEFPRRLSGNFRVDAWQRGTKFQYVQVVVAAKGAPNLAFPQEPKQIAYVLAGINEVPFPIRNRIFVFGGPLEPPLGRWIHFEFFLDEDFLRHWGGVPKDYKSLRVFFEVRYDGREQEDPEALADVYFDDLYLGDGSPGAASP